MAHLHNYESDDTRLGRGLGRLAPTTDWIPTLNEGGDYTTYVDVPSADPGTDSTYGVPNSAIRDLTDVSLSTSMPAPTTLPALNYATGAASCVDCTPTTTTAPAAAKVAATAAAVVTPMPEAPKTINYLLIAVGLGLGWALLKSGPKSGLGCAPEPAPVPAVQENLGRPPRKPKTGHKHVETLEL